MRLFDLTLTSPQENLAFDEALLVDSGGPTLRFWESPRPFVVLGRSSRRDIEVDLAACGADGAAIGRRVSGGATIVAGPGCLMYAVVLDLRDRPELADLTVAHRYVLGRVADALRSVEPSVVVAGTSDLAARRGGSLKKFSGNSMRSVRGRLLYHGTLLYRFDLDSMSRLLREAPRQPEYRDRRSHRDFVDNLDADRTTLKTQLIREWDARPAEPNAALLEVTRRLARDKYSTPGWIAAR